MNFLEIFMMTGYVILSLLIWVFTLGIILAIIEKLFKLTNLPPFRPLTLKTLPYSPEALWEIGEYY